LVTIALNATANLFFLLKVIAGSRFSLPDYLQFGDHTWQGLRPVNRTDKPPANAKARTSKSISPYFSWAFVS
jgi:hypothetical protein